MHVRFSKRLWQRALAIEPLEDRWLLSVVPFSAPLGGEVALRWEDSDGRPLQSLTYGDEVQLSVRALSLTGTEIDLAVYEDDMYVDELVDGGLSVTIGPDGVGRATWRVPWQDDLGSNPEYFFEALGYNATSRTLEVHEIAGGVSFLRDGFFAVAPWQAVLGEAIPVVMLYVNGNSDVCRPDLDFAEVRVGTPGTKVDLYSTPAGGEDLGLPSDLYNSRDFQAYAGDDFLELGVEPWWYTVGYIQPEDYAAHVLDGSLSVEVTYHWRPDGPWPVLQETVTPLSVSVAAGFPAWDHWYAGDTHFHSSITNSFDRDAFHAVDLKGLEDLIGVLFGEYGAPLALTSVIAEAVGLDWITVTDHSYEIDGSNDDEAGPEGDWYRDLSNPSDYQQAATEYLWEDLQSSPAFDEFLFLKGMEISVAAPLPHEPPKLPELIGVPSAQLHMLAYGFDPGDPAVGAPGFGDQMRDMTEIMPDLQRLSDPDAPVFAYAAHPRLQDNIFAEAWEVADATAAREFLDPAAAEPTPLFRGFEFWNERADADRDDSLALWDQVLDAIMSPDQGTDAHFTWYLSGGSDEHMSNHLVGKGNVGEVQTVLAAPALDRPDVLAALADGRAFVTDGPWFAMGLDMNGDGDFMDFGTDVMLGDQAVITDPALGVLTFDWPLQADTPWGSVGLGDVRLVHYNSEGVRDPHGDYTLNADPQYFDPQTNHFDAYQLWLDQGSRPGWQVYRAELRLSDVNTETFEAFTNPIWVYFDVARVATEVGVFQDGAAELVSRTGGRSDRRESANETPERSFPESSLPALSYWAASRYAETASTGHRDDTSRIERAATDWVLRFGWR